ncbi:MAG: hypothetical protein PHE61_01160 [Candidatus Omnitrophica bacterium]|nr:hypothetical protein [Candidatus Omnitrophota bacterium]
MVKNVLIFTLTVFIAVGFFITRPCLLEAQVDPESAEEEDIVKEDEVAVSEKEDVTVVKSDETSFRKEVMRRIHSLERRVSKIESWDQDHTQKYNNLRDTVQSMRRR